MLHNNLGEIDFDSMNETTQLALGTFLCSNLENNYFDTNEVYKTSTINSQSNTSTYYLFKLKNNIFRRERKDNKSGYRFQIIDNASKLGKGGDGYAQPSCGSIKIQDGHAFFKPKQRVIKVFQRAEQANREYKNLKQTHHMHPKPVTHLSHDLHMLTERRLPGVNLFELTDPDSDKHQTLDTNQLLWISTAVLNAILKQAHEIGLIHCDIKRENIMVDLAAKEVNLIDYCYSDNIVRENLIHDAGLTAIVAPYELFTYCPPDQRISTIKSDSYSAGKTLAEIWGAEPKGNNGPRFGGFFHTMYTYAKSDTAYDYTKLLTGDLSSTHITQLKTIFEQLTRATPKQRWTIEQALTTLQTMITERKQEALQISKAAPPPFKKLNSSIP